VPPTWAAFSFGARKMETNTEPQLLDLRQAAAFLGGGATVNFLRGQIASGRLKYLKVGKRFCVTRDALARWITTEQICEK
jgi:excisionase family DNA binding protein